MTTEHAESLLSAEHVELARAAGAEWGYQEADLWRDQHPAPIELDEEFEGVESDELPTHPEWTFGTWCGDNPFREARDVARDAAAEVDSTEAGVEVLVAASEKLDEMYEAFEKLVDHAAREAWDSYIEEEKKATAAAE